MCNVTIVGRVPSNLWDLVLARPPGYMLDEVGRTQWHYCVYELKTYLQCYQNTLAPGYVFVKEFCVRCTLAAEFDDEGSQIAEIRNCNKHEHERSKVTIGSSSTDTEHLMPALVTMANFLLIKSLQRFMACTTALVEWHTNRIEGVFGSERARAKSVSSYLIERTEKTYEAVARSLQELAMQEWEKVGHDSRDAEQDRE